MAIALSDELVLLQKETSQIKELNNTDHIYVARTSKGGTWIAMFSLWKTSQPLQPNLPIVYPHIPSSHSF